MEVGHVNSVFKPENMGVVPSPRKLSLADLAKAIVADVEDKWYPRFIGLLLDSTRWFMPFLTELGRDYLDVLQRSPHSLQRATCILGKPILVHALASTRILSYYPPVVADFLTIPLRPFTRSVPPQSSNFNNLYVRGAGRLGLCKTQIVGVFGRRRTRFGTIAPMDERSHSERYWEEG